MIKYLTVIALIINIAHSSPLNEAIRLAFDSGQGHQTDAFLLYQNGEIVHEQYSNGYTKDSPHALWSISKSILNLLIGISIKNKKISLDDSIPFISSPVNVKELLSMSSGLSWVEGYEGHNPTKSDVVRMLYSSPARNMAKFAYLKPTISPKKQFHYSSGTSNILSHYLAKVYSEQEYGQLPWKLLFDPIGIKSATWERDNTGTFVASSYLYLSTRDLLRLATHLLDKSSKLNLKLLPKDWMSLSTKPSQAFLNTILSDDENCEAHGLHWWTNANISKGDCTSYFSKLSQTAYFAQGHYGQLLIIIPEQQAIFIRLGSDKINKYPKQKIVNFIAQYLNQQRNIK